MPALPSYADKHLVGFREEVVSPVDRFTPDAGPDVVFRKFSGLQRVWQYEVVLSDSDLNSFLTFYNVDAGAGTVTITARHPRRFENRNVRFLEPPAPDFVGGEGWRVSFSLLVIPQGGTL